MKTNKFYEDALNKSLQLTYALHDGRFSEANALAIELTQMSRTLELDKEQDEMQAKGVIV